MDFYWEIRRGYESWRWCDLNYGLLHVLGRQIRWMHDVWRRRFRHAYRRGCRSTLRAIRAVTSLLSFSRIISLLGTKTAFCSTSWDRIMRMDLYESKSFLFSLSTALLTLMGSRTRSALVKGHSICWRFGGVRRSSVNLLIREPGGGLRRRWVRSRLDASRYLISLRYL